MIADSELPLEPPTIPAEPAPPIVGYARAIGRHMWLCAAVVTAAVAGAAGWIATHDPEYEASAQLLITPLAEGDTSFLGLPMLRTQGADPGRAVTTASALAEGRGIVVLTSDRLDGEVDPAAVEAAVEIVPVEDENIVEINATASSAPEAATIADAYAQSILASRQAELKPLIADAIKRTESELAKLPDLEGLRASELQGRLADLRFVEDGSDPTLAVAQAAAVPTDPTGPPPWLLLAVALLAGVALAAVTAIVTEILAPGAIADEDDLLRAYPLPILTRVPRSPRRLVRSRRGLELSPGAREAFRALRGQLEIRAGDRLRGMSGTPGLLDGVIAIISPITGDGKTATALSLGQVTAAAGSDVIILDADLRNPEIAQRLGIEADHDLATVIPPGRRLRQVATAVPEIDGLAFIAAPRTDNTAMIERVGASIPSRLTESLDGDLCVIVDTPALGEVSDALLLLPAVDHVVIAVRMNYTTHAALRAVRDSLERAGVRPVGFVVFDSPLAGGAPVTRARRALRGR